MNCTIRSLYLCVTDMDRAIAFCTAFVEQAPIRKDPVYSIFDIHGFRLGLFAFKELKEEHTFGTNCLPSIETDRPEDCFSFT